MELESESLPELHACPVERTPITSEERDFEVNCSFSNLAPLRLGDLLLLGWSELLLGTRSTVVRRRHGVERLGLATLLGKS